MAKEEANQKGKGSIQTVQEEIKSHDDVDIVISPIVSLNHSISSACGLWLMRGTIVGAAQ
jgi:hypothetical protein